jgi:hypothetical protein
MEGTQVYHSFRLSDKSFITFAQKIQERNPGGTIGRKDITHEAQKDFHQAILKLFNSQFKLHFVIRYLLFDILQAPIPIPCHVLKKVDTLSLPS